MTPEAQRISIAEACGWTHVFKGEHTDCIYGYPPVPTNNGCGDAVIPDFLNDLNAIIPAIAAQSIDVQEKVASLLGCKHDYAIWITTPAENMCEALMHALNLWDDSK